MDFVFPAQFLAGAAVFESVGAFAGATDLVLATTDFWKPTAITCRSRGETARDVMRLSSVNGRFDPSMAVPVAAGFFAGITKSGSAALVESVADVSFLSASFLSASDFPALAFSTSAFSVLTLNDSRAPAAAPSVPVRAGGFAG